MAILRSGGLLLVDWDRLADPPGDRIELLNGEVVVNAAPRPAHQDAGRYLANQLEAVCPSELKATTDIEWRNLDASGGIVVHSLRPDVVVTRRLELRRAKAIVAAPVIAVEILSPSNTSGELTAKREVYLQNGLQCYVEVVIDDDEDHVAVRWFVPGPQGWELLAAASGDEVLEVATPFSFRLVPDSLLGG